MSEKGVKAAAKQVLEMINKYHYAPSTWRTQPLHLVPPAPFDPVNPLTKQCLDWIFLVSALNFSFWSDLEGSSKRFGVTWKSGWDNLTGPDVKWEGYWSLLAALNKALVQGIPITDPSFYADPTACPDSLLEDIFKSSDECTESMPLVHERISIMRQVGKIMVHEIPGQSYMGLLNSLLASPEKKDNTLALLEIIVERFPCFRDESVYMGRKVVFWKRAQILIAETWAAFYPIESSDLHPLLPDGVDGLTMFADYRVPQILQSLGVLSYSPELVDTLRSTRPLAYASELESSIRAGGIIAVEELKHCMEELDGAQKHSDGLGPAYKINSVLIDFFLWDLAKLVENGDHELATLEALPCHRTRSIYY